MSVDQCDVRAEVARHIVARTDGGRAHRHHEQTGTFLAATATGGLFAGVFLVVSAVIIRAVTGGKIGTGEIVLMAAATVVGASVSSWLAQPIVSRFIADLTVRTTSEKQTRPPGTD